MERKFKLLKLLFPGQSGKYFNVTDFWIGLNTFSSVGNWTWIDQSPYDFHQWGTTLSPNVTMNCAAMKRDNGNGDWDTNDCFIMKPSVCKFAPAPTPTNKPYSECPENWFYFEPTHSCYGIDDRDAKGNWNAAESICVKYGFHLVSIQSYDEAKFVGSKFRELGIRQSGNPASLGIKIWGSFGNLNLVSESLLLVKLRHQICRFCNLRNQWFLDWAEFQRRRKHMDLVRQ